MFRLPQSPIRHHHKRSTSSSSSSSGFDPSDFVNQLTNETHRMIEPAVSTFGPLLGNSIRMTGESFEALSKKTSRFHSHSPSSDRSFGGAENRIATSSTPLRSLQEHPTGFEKKTRRRRLKKSSTRDVLHHTTLSAHDGDDDDDCSSVSSVISSKHSSLPSSSSSSSSSKTPRATTTTTNSTRSHHHHAIQMKQIDDLRRPLDEAIYHEEQEQLFISPNITLQWRCIHTIQSLTKYTFSHTIPLQPTIQNTQLFKLMVCNDAPATLNTSALSALITVIEHDPTHRYHREIFTKRVWVSAKQSVTYHLTLTSSSTIYVQVKSFAIMSSIQMMIRLLAMHCESSSKKVRNVIEDWSASDPNSLVATPRRKRERRSRHRGGNHESSQSIDDDDDDDNQSQQMMIDSPSKTNHHRLSLSLDSAAMVSAELMNQFSTKSTNGNGIAGTSTNHAANTNTKSNTLRVPTAAPRYRLHVRTGSYNPPASSSTPAITTSTGNDSNQVSRTGVITAVEEQGVLSDASTDYCASGTSVSSAISTKLAETGTKIASPVSPIALNASVLLSDDAQYGYHTNANTQHHQHHSATSDRAKGKNTADSDDGAYDAEEEQEKVAPPSNHVNKSKAISRGSSISGSAESENKQQQDTSGAVRDWSRIRRPSQPIPIAQQYPSKHKRNSKSKKDIIREAADKTLTNNNVLNVIDDEATATSAPAVNETMNAATVAASTSAVDHGSHNSTTTVRITGEDSESESIEDVTEQTFTHLSDNEEDVFFDSFDPQCYKNFVVIQDHFV